MPTLIHHRVAAARECKNQERPTQPRFARRCATVCDAHRNRGNPGNEQPGQSTPGP
jgi:hypothetical protein